MPLPAPAPPNYTGVYCDPVELAAAADAAARPPLPIVGAYPPMWAIRPPGATDLYATARGALAAVAGATLDLAPPAPSEFRIPSGFDGVLADLWLTVITPVLAMDVTFSLLKNGGPVQGWTGFAPIPAPAAFVTMPITGPLQLEQNDLLTVRALNVTGLGPFTVQVDLFGWQYPQDLKRSIFGDAGLG